MKDFHYVIEKGEVGAADYYENRAYADIPDAPWIRRAETYGDPWYDPIRKYVDDYEEDYE